jgi:hypothetical protein
VQAVLAVRVLAVPEFNATFTSYLKMLMSLNLTQLSERMNTVQSLIFPQLKVLF